MRHEFVVGSRGSALALSQTERVLSLLRRATGASTFRIQTIHAAADRSPDVSLANLPGVGFFVKELEVALLEERVDAAVHSMKDLPTEETPGLVIAAMPEREDPRDVLLARDGLMLPELPPRARVGTGSPRRAASLRAVRPDLEIVPVRGNVETRIRKVDEGVLDAVCLAAAGLLRLGLAHRITQWLPVDQALPAPGQGALGVQVRAADTGALGLVRVLDDRRTRQAVLAERAVLRRMQGGCRLPVGALAETDGERLFLRAAVIAPDGSQTIEGTRTGPAAEAEALGTDLAEELLAQGAGELLPDGAGVPG